MRAKPSDARITSFLHTAKGWWSFSVVDVAQIMGVGHRSAERYISKMKNKDLIRLKYKDVFNYYEVKRESR
jgi:Mn-dependent DtxR family transcriptional regulator